MVDATSPDGIALWTNADPTSLVQESQTQGASIQVALDKRERYDFVWANSSQRTSQTGMVQGSRGYQSDTKSEYIYDNSTWRLALPYAQVSSTSTTCAAGAFTAVNNFTIDNSLSTDITFVQATGNTITLVSPGVYSMTFVGRDLSSAGMPGISQVMISTNSNSAVANDRVGVGYFNGTILATAPLIYNAPSANFNLYFFYYNGDPGSKNVSGLLRIARIG